MEKKKSVGIIFFLSVIIFGVTGCSVEKLSEKKQMEVDYEIVHPFDIPKEMTDEIEKEKNRSFWFAYGDKGELYVARGYGEQESDGYEIEVLEVYESENALIIKTQLNGPDYGIRIKRKKTCPYIVLKMKDPEKVIVVK